MPSDTQTKRHLYRGIIAVALTALGLGVCIALDTTVTDYGLRTRDEDARKHGDLYNLFRVMGFLPTWLIVGGALFLVRPVPRRADLNHVLWSFSPLFSGLLAGLLAVVLKLVFRRVRVDLVDGAWYVFRPFSDGPMDGRGLSLPSDHAAVAFGAAFMLMRMYPKGWPVFLIIGVGCGVTRLARADHYPSDVFVAGLIGYAVAWVLVRIFGMRNEPYGSLLPRLGKGGSA